MLMVKARVGISAIHGFGLIAKQFIPAGAVIWRFNPAFDLEISENKLEILSPAAKEQVLYYAEYKATTRTFVLSSDDDRFTNHSDTPNTRSIGDVVYAVRDIADGEEITCDYREVIMWAFQPSKICGIDNDSG